MQTLLLAALALGLLVVAPTAAADPIEAEVDLTWLNSCPGPWGHEERTTVGPVTVVTYECDDGGS